MTRVHVLPLRRTALLAVLLTAVPGCSTRSVPSGEMAAVAPMLSVERFLQAANARDLEAMARIFGTAGGPIADTGSTIGCAFKKFGDWIGLGNRCVTREEVEIRMDAIAQIIQHEDYQIVSESRVAGRRNPTTRIGVNLEMDDDLVPDVPFVVVRTSEGRWMVEEIGLERITQR
ncbi:MAG: hypothetical protein GWN82_12155 [Gemmatimonadetes bacterium]|nr:hypothetical protein [Gemmatimonadota bacterium]NIU31435.1 hypothetical protein [Gemmatimonadota bacterium]NIU36116.1 hypothetical protein [Gemmatimonadota bacterium]NIV61787.1 hypothetical protein [Gemmatimonadota bacterium]NIV83024.1 hypothetical protein [Gemmatimonadota bacterium]